MSAGDAAPGPATETGAAFVIHVPAARILAAREARLIEIARNLHRAAPPGTVPEAVRRRFATGVLSEVLERAVEEEVARILAASPELNRARRVVEDLSFGDSEGLRFRLRVLPATPQPAPPARPGAAPREAG
uniref:trigger factor family protein n=1 Tax=Neoroseomonas rubea TaxID=2748666 RepID=UPI001E2F1663